MTAAIIVERSLALIYFTCGISLLLNPQAWLEFIETLKEERTTKMLGLFTLFLGSFMLISHNIWEASPRVLTTIISYIAVGKGAVLLTWPKLLTNMMDRMPMGKTFLRVEGLGVSILAMVIYSYS